MATYKELTQQIEALRAQAEAARRDEISGVVSDIRAKMIEYDLTVEDIAPRRAGQTFRRSPGAGVGSVPAKYRHPVTGETWTGRGKMPKWLAAEVGEGKSRDAFLIVA